ncbi:MAG: hypothetical protein GTO45_13595 [Candidatus Aminicenantes bacterium]|nr:hypothetical protein [Candidatus Aminicenantes bacterium]NIM79810.1 hypothetical protein [Candidatus Aminicenantes bacterium]NIN19140.1 hypothetical protein [Candidatus Aminicenantes bacterium]NIN43044.1 hypothetical protein [Candidatus Aminicenantes bacterium]NIN85785.1 hypothetical protein [Candidatus Aminicenantes bacterium]
MFEIWANVGLLLGAAVVAGVAYFVLYIIGKVVFEDIIGGIIRRIRRKKEKDHYIY